MWVSIEEKVRINVLSFKTKESECTHYLFKHFKETCDKNCTHENSSWPPGVEPKLLVLRARQRFEQFCWLRGVKATLEKIATSAPEADISIFLTRTFKTNKQKIMKNWKTPNKKQKKIKITTGARRKETRWWSLQQNVGGTSIALYSCTRIRPTIQQA